MQLTTLNKIVNLLLAGSFALALAYFLVGQFEFLDRLAEGLTVRMPGEMAVASAITLVMFAGILSEAATDLARGIKNTPLGRYLPRLLLVGSRHAATLTMKRRFVEAISPEAGGKQEWSGEDAKNLALALVFERGSVETVSWVLQHFSLSLLATNYALLTVVFGFAILFSKLEVKVELFVVCIVAAYLLCYVAARKYIFTYHELYRQAHFLACQRKMKVSNY